MSGNKNLNLVNDRRDEEVWPYIEQLMNDQNCLESHESNNSPRAAIEENEESGHTIEQNEESDSLETRKVRGPTLLKDIWNMPRGKTINVKFNDRNQAIGKEGRKLASFLGIVARLPALTPLNIGDWRSFDNDEKNKLVAFVRKKFSIPTCGEEFVKKSLGKKWKDYKCELRRTYMTMYKTKYALLKNRPDRIPKDQWVALVSHWVSDKGKKRSQANRRNRAKLKMAHTGGSKSIGTLMDETAVDGIEPTRAEVFLLTHKKRKDGRPLDEESAKIVDIIQEKLYNCETSNEQPIGSVAWEGDVYSQVLGTDRSGYVRGLGLGPTPVSLWGSKSSSGNINLDDTSKEEVQRLQQEVKELKELKEKHALEMDVMKKNQDKMDSELCFMKQVMYKFLPAELFASQNLTGSSSRQVPDTNGNYEQASLVVIDKNLSTSRGTSFPLKKRNIAFKRR